LQSTHLIFFSVRQLTYMKFELAGASVTAIALIIIIALFGLGQSRGARGTI
jgi:hypothetical protein